MVLAFAVLWLLVDRAAGAASTLLLYPPFYWALLVLCAKRLHDRDRSAVWLLGPLWLGFQLGLLRGTRGENSFGPDPRKGRLNCGTVE